MLCSVIRKAIAWAPMHACYGVGHFTSLVMNWGDGWFGWLYPVYNRLMEWSVDLNDWAGFRLWRWYGDDQ